MAALFGFTPKSYYISEVLKETGLDSTNHLDCLIQRIENFISNTTFATDANRNAVQGGLEILKDARAAVRSKDGKCGWDQATLDKVKLFIRVQGDQFFQDHVSLDWMRRLSRSRLDSSSSPLVTLVRRHQRDFQAFLNSFTKDERKNFSNDLKEFFNELPSSNFTLDQITDSLFLELLSQSDEYFFALCDKLSEKEEADLKKAMKDAGVRVPRNWMDSAEACVRFPVTVAKSSLVFACALPCVNSFGIFTLPTSWYVAGALGATWTTGVTYYGDTVAEKIDNAKGAFWKPLKKAKDVAKSVYKGGKEVSQKYTEVKEGVKKGVKNVPFISSYLIDVTPSFTGISFAALFGLYSKLSLAETVAAALAEPAYKGSWLARFGIAYLLANDYLFSSFAPFFPDALKLTAQAASIGAESARIGLNYRQEIAFLVTRVAVPLYVCHWVYKKTPSSAFVKRQIDKRLGWAQGLFTGDKKIQSDKPPKEPQPKPSEVLGEKSTLGSILDSVSKLPRACHDKVEQAIADPKESGSAIETLFEEVGVSSDRIRQAGSFLGEVEAYLNWGGRIPVVNIATGSIRMAAGVVTAAVSSVIGVAFLAAGSEAKREGGKALIREYALLHGAGNIVRGFIEVTSWYASIFTSLVWDGTGQRFSYLKEESSKAHLLPTIKSWFGGNEESGNVGKAS